MTSIKERLISIAENEGLSVRAFEERCGLGRGNISNMGPNSAIGSDKLTKILDTFPNIDLNWILTGVEQKPIEGTDATDGTNSILLEKVITQAEEIGSLKERIRQLEQRLGKTADDASIGATANVG